VTLTIVGKPDCHLCHEMADVVRRTTEGRIELVEADVRANPEWMRLYRYEIPVLLWNGQEIARHRISEDELRRKLVSLTGG
jgi:hypothetical protein